MEVIFMVKKEKLAFEPINNGSAYSVSLAISDFTERDTVDITEIAIPAVYNNLPVTEIGNDAFMRCNALKNVTIPDSVKSIGKRAFSCSGLTSITIPKSVSKKGGAHRQRRFFRQWICE